MRRYRSHKIVEAAPIVTIDPNGGYVIIENGGEADAVAVPPNFFARGTPEKGDYLVRYSPDDYKSWSPRQVFLDGYRAAEERGPVLMSPENPDGWKLEEILETLRLEIEGKSEKIAQDGRPVARAVLRHNQQIIGLLLQATALQKHSYDLLDATAPNQGPLGKPRIGIGS